jgi:hypothetical protein
VPSTTQLRCRRELLQEALAAFGRADEALRNGNLAAYQAAVLEAQRLHRAGCTGRGRQRRGAVAGDDEEELSDAELLEELADLEDEEPSRGRGRGLRPSEPRGVRSTAQRTPPRFDNGGSGWVRSFHQRRGVEQFGQLAGLITRRSQVQILPPLPRKGPSGPFRISWVPYGCHSSVSVERAPSQPRRRCARSRGGGCAHRERRSRVEAPPTFGSP